MDKDNEAKGSVVFDCFLTWVELLEEAEKKRGGKPQRNQESK
ncbi:hypothetical protein [Caldivirga maquilingensis]|nr:hypothetical protein [Caldivirga maquilingensis]